MGQGAHPSVRACLAWIASNLLGWFMGAALALALRMPGSPFNSPAMFIVVIVPPSLAQWLLLRRLFGVTPWWLITIPLGFVTFVGFAIAIPAGLWEVVDDEGLGTLSVLYAVLGGLIGLVQWLILRKHFGVAGIWVAASAAGTGVGLAIVRATDLIDASGFAAFTVVALTYAVLSGGALTWLLARPAPRQVSSAA